MSENNTNRLVEFIRYWPGASLPPLRVCVASDEVAVIEETQAARGNVETQTVITLKNGAVYPVVENIAEVRRKLGR